MFVATFSQSICLYFLSGFPYTLVLFICLFLCLSLSSSLSLILQDSKVMEKNAQCTSGSPDPGNDSENEDTDPMEVFNEQLEDIIKTYGSAASLMEQQISSLEAGEDRGDQKQEEPGGEDGSGSARGTRSSKEAAKKPQKQSGR